MAGCWKKVHLETLGNLADASHCSCVWHTRKRESSVRFLSCVEKGLVKLLRYAQQAGRFVCPIVKGVESVDWDDNHLTVGARDPLFSLLGCPQKVDNPDDHIEGFGIGMIVPRNSLAWSELLLVDGEGKASIIAFDLPSEASPHQVKDFAFAAPYFAQAAVTQRYLMGWNHACGGLVCCAVTHCFLQAGVRFPV